MNPGKVFEQDFENSFFVKKKLAGGKKTFAHQRYPFISIDRVYDNTGGYAGVSGFCDYTVFLQPNLFFFELKSTQEKSLPFSNFTDKQLGVLWEKAHIQGVIAGAVIQWRSVNSEVYFLPIQKLVFYKNTAERVSIPYAFCREAGFLLYGELLRTRFRFDVFPWLMRLSGREYCAN